MESDSRKKVFYYDSIRMLKFDLAQAVLFGSISLLFFGLDLVWGHRVRVVAMVFLGLSLLFFIQSMIALIFRKVPLIEIGDSEVTIYSGMIGFRRKLVLPRDALEAGIETVAVNNPFKLMLKETGSVEMPALVFRLNQPEASGLGRFCSTALFDFACSDDRKKIILRIPPTGGFEQVIAALCQRRDLP